MEQLFGSKPSEVFYPKTFDNLANLASELHKCVLELQDRVSELENSKNPSDDYS